MPPRIAMQVIKLLSTLGSAALTLKTKFAETQGPARTQGRQCNGNLTYMVAFVFSPLASVACCCVCPRMTFCFAHGDG